LILAATGVVGAVPVVHEAVGRAGVEARNAAGGRQYGDVGDAAQIDHQTVFGMIRQQFLVDQRRQRRALAAGGKIGAPEVGDHLDTGGLGDPARVADLQRVRERIIGSVQYGLAVTADHAHVLSLDAGTFQQRQCGLGEGLADLGVEPGQSGGREMVRIAAQFVQ